MRKETHETYQQRIMKVQLYIQDHLDDQLALDELAEIASFSPYHFHRIFRGMVGESVKEYVRRLRLERAALELMHSQAPVTTIAFDAGYETHESFTRAFRTLFELPPITFRQKYRDRSQSFELPRCQIRTTPETSDLKGTYMEVKIQTFEPMTVASVRHTGPYEECKAAWDTLCANPSVQRLFGPNTVFLGMCYDDPDVTEADKIRYDACVTAPDDFVPEAPVQKQSIPGGEYAVVFHKGSYSNLHATYRWLFGQWFPNSGREPQCAPSLEICHTNPETTPEEELLTEIRVPLK